jgi:uncharacterized CHY-type Zn-finger protein
MDTEFRCTRCRGAKPQDEYRMCTRCRDQMRGQYYKYRRAKELVREDQKHPHRRWSEEQGRLKPAGLKRCPRCRKTLARSSFGTCSQCKACMSDRRKDLRAWNSQLKVDRGCADCGETFADHPERLHWDHLPGFEKKAGISEMITRLNSKEDILKETQKCEVVCWSCHFKRGKARGQIGKPSPPYTHRPRPERVKLPISYWQPPKARRPSIPKWLWGQTVYDGQGNRVEQYDEVGQPVPLLARLGSPSQHRLPPDRCAPSP